MVSTIEELRYYTDDANGFVKEFKKNDETIFRYVDIEKAAKHWLKKRIENGGGKQINVMPHKVQTDRWKKDFNVKMTFVKDAETGIVLGKVVDNINGQPKFKRIAIDGFRSFDLKKKNDLEDWFIVRYSDSIKDSCYAHNINKVYFDVFDPKEKLSSDFNRAKLFNQAFILIEELSTSKAIDYARYFGLDIKSDYDKNDVKSLLVQEMQNDPKKFLDKIEAETREYEIVVANAIKTGVVNYRDQDGYYYNDVKIGISKNDILQKIVDDDVIFNNIVKAINSVDDVKIAILTKEKPNRLVSEEETSNSELKKGKTSSSNKTTTSKSKKNIKIETK